MKRRAKVSHPYIHRFDSEYEVGNIVTVRNGDGKKMPGTFTLMSQARDPKDRRVWTAVRKWGKGQSYREEYRPILDEDIIEWVDNKVDLIKRHAKREIIDAS